MHSRVVHPESRDYALAVRGSQAVLDEHLRRLSELPAHGNRCLRYDQLLMGLLLAFFEPMARSLRTIEARGSFRGRLDLDRLARSTTADALRVFDPVHLKPLIEDLTARVPSLAASDPTLLGISRQIIAADGTYFNTLADVTWALRHTKTDGRKQGQVRANVQLDVATWTPQVVSISGDDGKSEPAAFVPDLLPDVLYVADRAFGEFEFLSAVLARRSDFVVRLRSNGLKAEVLRELPVSAADAEAGVNADEIVRLTGRGAPTVELRRTTLNVPDRAGENAPSARETGPIILLTSLISPEVPARVIGTVYERRWQIELFFKWLKTWARMDHLLSTSRAGITFELYVMVIGVLMLYVQTGRRVSIYALAVMSWVAQGTMSMAEAMEVIARREREKDLARARQARKRAQKKLA